MTRPCPRPWLQDPQLNCGELGTLHVLVPNGPATGPQYGPGQVGQPVVDGGESTPCGAQRLVGMTSKAAGPCRPPGLGKEESQEPLPSSFLPALPFGEVQACRAQVWPQREGSGRACYYAFDPKWQR